jgi:hypothetical protein
LDLPAQEAAPLRVGPRGYHWAKHRRRVEKLRSGLLCLRDLDAHCHKANGQNELALIAHPRSLLIRGIFESNRGKFTLTK